MGGVDADYPYFWERVLNSGNDEFVFLVAKTECETEVACALDRREIPPLRNRTPSQERR